MPIRNPHLPCHLALSDVVSVHGERGIKSAPGTDPVAEFGQKLDGVAAQVKSGQQEVRAGLEEIRTKAAQLDGVASTVGELEVRYKGVSDQLDKLLERIRGVEAAKSRPPESGGPGVRSLGELVTEHPVYKDGLKHASKSLRIALEPDLDGLGLFAAGRKNLSGFAVTNLSGAAGGVLPHTWEMPGIQRPRQPRTRLRGLIFSVTPTPGQDAAFSREVNYRRLYTELTATAASGQKVLKVQKTGGFYPGQSIVLGDPDDAEATRETAIVESVDQKKGEVRVTANLTHNWTVSTSATVPVTSQTYGFVPQTEAAAKQKISFEKVSVVYKTLRATFTIAKEMLEDAPALSAYLNTRIEDEMIENENFQLLYGPGTTDRSILGMLKDPAVSPVLWSQQPTGNNRVDLLLYSIAKLRDDGFPPGTMVLNPFDMWRIATTKDAQGRYLFLEKTPFAGVDVVEHGTVKEGEAILGDFGGAMTVFNRKGVTIEMHREHEDYAERGLVLLAIEQRFGFIVNRPGALLKPTFDAEPGGGQSS